VIISEGMALIERLADRVALPRHRNRGKERDRDRERDRESSPPSLPDEKGTASGSVAGVGAVPGAGAVVGAVAVNEPSEALDFLFIDADSKDSSLGLSAPPAAFLTAHALKSLYQGTCHNRLLFPPLPILLLSVIDVRARLSVCQSVRLSVLVVCLSSCRHYA
jgi:hypothetical protein